MADKTSHNNIISDNDIFEDNFDQNNLFDDLSDIENELEIWRNSTLKDSKHSLDTSNLNEEDLISITNLDMEIQEEKNESKELSLDLDNLENDKENSSQNFDIDKILADIDELEDIKPNVTNCLALTLPQDYKLTSKINVISHSAKITFKIFASSIALCFLKLFF